MKRYLVLVLMLVLCLWLNSQGNNYGGFGVGTSSTDSAFLFTHTFDTLGQSANADSVYFITLWRGTLRVDSVRVTSPTRTGYFTTARRAVDSTTAPAGRKLGEYVVYIKWWINGGKVFDRADCYTVIDTVHTPRTGYSINLTYPDSTLRLRGLAIRGTTGSDTAIIAAGIGYGMGLFISGGATGADGIYALGGGTGAGFHAKGGTGDGAEGIFAEGTGSGPGTYSLGGSSAPGLQVIGQGSGSGIRADGGSSGNGITATGFATGSGIRAVKGGTGYDIYGDIQGNLSGSVNSVTLGVTVTTNNDKTGYSLADYTPFWNVAFNTAFTAGSMGDSLNNASYVQGSASGLTAQQVWEYATRALTDKAGFGLASSQTFNNTGTWTGNLTGSAGSVTAGVTVTTNNDKTGYALTTAYLTKADSGSTGASYLRAKYVEDKTGYRLSSQGQVDIWITDTTGLNSGWSQFFKGRLDTDVSRIDTTIQKTAKRLAGKGNRQRYFYNSKGYMDSMYYFDAATLLARWIYYRPADTLAPDSTYSYDY